LEAGKLLQYGPTPEVFHRPASLQVARAFSDPPINLIAASVASSGLQLALGDGLVFDLHAGQSPGASMMLGLRANALRVQARAGDLSLKGLVELAEISGSDTFLHVRTAVGGMVVQLTGVHYFELGSSLALHFNADHAYVFDEHGALKIAPQHVLSSLKQVA
jgi:glycerol transport system ATP-binding protein